MDDSEEVLIRLKAIAFDVKSAKDKKLYADFIKTHLPDANYEFSYLYRKISAMLEELPGTPGTKEQLRNLVKRTEKRIFLNPEPKSESYFEKLITNLNPWKSAASWIMFLFKTGSFIYSQFPA